jgi:polar amino acid transport system substrate-binding protein
MGFGPNAANVDREAIVDMVNWTEERVFFAVQQGNPTGLESIETACGLRVAVMSGSSAEGTLQRHNEEFCSVQGEPPVEVQAHIETPAALLAVRAERADAFFTSGSVLRYYVEQVPDDLDLAAEDEDNAYGRLIQGAIIEKGSLLADALLAAFEVLFEDGTYEAIMEAAALDGNILQGGPAKNLATQLAGQGS